MPVKKGKSLKKWPWNKIFTREHFQKMTFMYLRLKVGMKTVKKKQNYGRETKMLPVNKVAKKRAKSSVHGHFFVSRGKKKHCGYEVLLSWLYPNPLSKLDVFVNFDLLLAVRIQYLIIKFVQVSISSVIPRSSLIFLVITFSAPTCQKLRKL